MLICFVVYILAPKAYSVTTARYNAGTKKQNEEVLNALGSDHTEEEQLVNDFAVAYWMMYGEEDKLERMEEITSHAINSIESDAKEGQNYMDFAKERWGKSGFFAF